jgi:adenine/guanine phosphoribosyltransferase-like PRPP-binding protein
MYSEANEMTASYLRKVFDPKQLRRIATETELIRKDVGADIVVARGLSGTLAATAMGTLFGTSFAIIRKSDENNNGRSVEVVEDDHYDEDTNTFITKKYKNWIIVDDLICSGGTIKAIAKAVANRPGIFTGKCKGIVLYNPEDGDDISRHHRIEDGLVPVFQIGGKIRDVSRNILVPPRGRSPLGI